MCMVRIVYRVSVFSVFVSVFPLVSNEFHEDLETRINRRLQHRIAVVQWRTIVPILEPSGWTFEAFKTT